MPQEQIRETQREQGDAVKPGTMDRRTFLKQATILTVGSTVGGSLLAACGNASSGGTPSNPTTGPTIVSSNIKNVTLRQIGTGVSAYNEIRDQAQKDLGFKLTMKAVDSDTNNQIVITQPRQFDIFDGEFFSLPLVVPSGNIQGIDTKRIKEFNKIVPLFTTGKLTPDTKIAQGTAPHKVFFQGDRSRFTCWPPFSVCMSAIFTGRSPPL